MKCELIAGIEAISGSLKQKNGTRVIFRTYRKPSVNRKDGESETRVYIRSEESFQRKKPLSEKECKVRGLFVRRQAYVHELMTSGRCRTKKEAWKIAKEEIRA